MNRGLYTTATGMQSAQQMLDVVAHNLANASTAGFKRDGLAFNDGLERALNADAGRGAPLGTLGSGAVALGRFTDFSRGNLTPTGNPLDVAVRSEDGVFAVETPAGVRYTRDGSFSLDAARRIVDRDGAPVLDREGRAITLPAGKVEVADDGTVSVDGKAVGQIGLFAGRLEKEGANRFVGDDMTPVVQPQMQPMAVESSNVNPVEEMIALIRINRTFEMAQKSAQGQDEITQRLLQSLSGR